MKMTKLLLFGLLVVGLIPPVAAQQCDKIMYNFVNDGLYDNGSGTCYQGGTAVYISSGTYNGWVKLGTSSNPAGSMTFGGFADQRQLYFYYTSACTETVYIDRSTDAGSNWSNVHSFIPSTSSYTTPIKYITTTTFNIGDLVKIYRLSSCPSGGTGASFHVNRFGFAGTVPVELTGFRAKLIDGRKIQLDWETVTEKNNYGFEIEREISDNNWNFVGFVSGHGTVNTTQTYTFSDNLQNTNMGSIVKYRLKQIDRDGSITFSPVIAISLATSKKNFGLDNVFPNPFNPSTTITFTLPSDQSVSLKVFNTTGQMVAHLIDDEILTTGQYSRAFDAQDLPTGTYNIWLYSKDQSSVQTVSLIK